MRAIWLNGSFSRIHAAGAGALALMTATVYLGAVEPVLSDKVARLELETRMSVERKRASDLASQISSKSREMEQVNLDTQKAKVQLEPASNVNARVGDLASLAARTGVRIVRLQPEHARPGDRYGVVPMSVRGEGSYAKCTAFLELLAKRFKDVGVRSLRLSGNGLSAGSDLSFEFELAWYVSPTEKSN